MRYQVNQTIFAVYFSSKNRDFKMFSEPLLYDNEPVTDIEFGKLTVTEHHKVCGEWDEPATPPKYDGYLLQDENGTVFANQYPTASYGQTSDTANRRFNRHNETDDYETLKAAGAVYEYNLLSDSLEAFQRGIKELGAVPETDDRYEQAKVKRKLLQDLYDRTVADFHDAYPDYTLTMKWKPAFEGSTLIWPNIYISQKTAEPA